MKVVLEYVKHEEKTSNSGNAYTACSIKVRGQFYNGFGNEITRKWIVGQVIDVDLWEEPYQDKVSRKFVPMPPDDTEKYLLRFEERLSRVEKFLMKRFMQKVPETGSQVEPPKEQPKEQNEAENRTPDDLPF